MKSIIVFAFILNLLLANCTQEQITTSNNLYQKADQSTNPQQQIKLLKASLKSCYAPEIEASLLILQAQESNNTTQKIEFYKKSLVSISNFQDTNLLFEYQCQINRTLSTLYKNIDKEVSAIYLEKALALCSTQRKKRNYWWVGLFFVLLIGWGILNFLLFILYSIKPKRV